MRKVVKVNKAADEEPKTGRCIDCAHGYVMSDGVKGNPLIIECGINKVRNPQSWCCTTNSFQKRTGEMEVHPMIFLNRKQ